MFRISIASVCRATLTRIASKSIELNSTKALSTSIQSTSFSSTRHFSSSSISSQIRPVAGPYGVNEPEKYLANRAIAEEWALKFGYYGLYETNLTWGSTDSFFHLNNVATLRFFEDARMVFIQSILPELSPTSEEAIVRGRGGVGIILASLSSKFRRPVTYPDTLILGHRVESISKDRFTLSVGVWSFKQGKEVTTGSVDLVTYDHGKLSKADIPSDLRIALEKRLRK